MRGSILLELGWLLYFIAVLVVSVYALNLFLVPQHFNPTIANVLAGILAAVIFVASRSYARRKR